MLQDEVADLGRRLEQLDGDLVPEVVGAASRIQELATDMLALSRFACESGLDSQAEAVASTMP